VRESWDRAAPWTGVLFVILVLAGGVSVGGAPGSGASAAQVLAYYRDHRMQERVGAALLTFAFVAFLAFSVVVSRHLHRYAQDGLATFAMAGATLLAGGQMLSASVHWALADRPAALAPAGLQALNVAANDFVLVSAGGWFAFSVAVWLAILRSRALPVWLGWISLAVALLVVSPAELIGFVIFLVWTLITSGLLWARWPAHDTERVGVTV